MVKVWTDAWQLQCCGEEWSLDDVITWTASSHVDKDFLRAVVGDDARDIVFVEEHHQDDLVDETVAGTVRQILAISCVYAPASSEAPQTLYPVPGTTVVEEVRTAQTWHPAPSSSLKFVGFVTTVEKESG
jgi:hypothetical protein